MTLIILLFLFIIIIPLVIVVISGSIKQNQIEIEKTRQNELVQQEIKEEKEKYLKLQELKKQFETRKEDLQKLTDQYYTAVYNYIESLPFSPFCILKKSNLSPCLLISLYWHEANDLLKCYTIKDGFQKVNIEVLTDEMESAQENTKIFVSELKERILSVWDNDETISSAIYFIIRNNVVRYYYDALLEDGVESIDQICTSDYLDKDSNMISDTAKAFYTYLWIYKNDISAPIRETYNKISTEIDEFYAQYLLQAKKDYFFSDHSDYSKDHNESDSLYFSDPTNFMYQIDLMNGREFEEFIAEHFKKKGYKVILTPSSGDYGIDVIIENEFLKIGIQTKCYSDKVSNSAVQEAVTGIKHYGLDKAMVITNNYFQPSAIRLAKDNNVILWDRNKLEEELQK